MLERDQTSAEPNFSSSSLSSGSSSSSSSALSTGLDTSFLCSSLSLDERERLKRQAYFWVSQAQRQRMRGVKSPPGITTKGDGSVEVSVLYQSRLVEVVLSKKDIEIKGLDYLVGYLWDLHVALIIKKDMIGKNGSYEEKISFLCGQVYNTVVDLHQEKVKDDWKGEKDHKAIFHDLISLAIGALTSDEEDIAQLEGELKRLKNHPFNQWSCGRWFLMALGALVFFAGFTAVAAGFTGAAESFRVSNSVAKVGGAALSLLSAVGLYKGWKSKENKLIDNLSQLANSSWMTRNLRFPRAGVYWGTDRV